MANEDLDNTTYFDTSNAPRHPKCNLRHTLQSLEMMNVDSCQIGYGEKFPFRMIWNSENARERLKFKMIVNATALLDAAESIDLSDAVLAKVNDLYAQEKSEKPAETK
jgi:hypothetical protein